MREKVTVLSLSVSQSFCHTDLEDEPPKDSNKHQNVALGILIPVMCQNFSFRLFLGRTIVSDC